MSNRSDGEFLLHGRRSLVWDKTAGAQSSPQLTSGAGIQRDETGRGVPPDRRQSTPTHCHGYGLAESGREAVIGGAPHLPHPNPHPHPHPHPHSHPDPHPHPAALDMEYKKTVSFHKYNSDSGVSTNTDQASNNPSVVSEPHANGDVSSNHDSDYSGSTAGSGPTRGLSRHHEWLIRPVHLERSDHDGLHAQVSGGTSLSDRYLPPGMAALASSTLTSGQGTSGAGYSGRGHATATLLGSGTERRARGGSGSGGHRAGGGSRRGTHHHHPTSNARRSGSKTSTSAAARAIASPTHRDRRQDALPADSAVAIDALVREFFPVTLGASYTLSSMQPTATDIVGGSAASTAPTTAADASVAAATTPTPTPTATNQRPAAASRGPAKTARRPTPANTGTWKANGSKSPGGKRRPGSAQSSSSSTSRNSIDKMYFLLGEAPTIGSTTVLLSSPYQSELARLRMERLKIEEDHLLQVKRQEELERIRGPKPKWYEMKSPRFHYEARKNTELLRSEKSWQELLDYRCELERASNNWQSTRNHKTS